MLQELSVVEQRYLAVREVLDGAKVLAALAYPNVSYWIPLTASLAAYALHRPGPRLEQGAIAGASEVP